MQLVDLMQFVKSFQKGLIFQKILDSTISNFIIFWHHFEGGGASAVSKFNYWLIFKFAG